MKRKIIVFLLCCFLLTACAGAKETDHGKIQLTGKFGAEGENLEYTLYEDGLLKISGTGEMKTDEIDTNMGWKSSQGSIKSLEICDGVTSIGMMAFAGCENLECVTLTGDVVHISYGAFDSCRNIKDLYYPGTVNDFSAIKCYDSDVFNNLGRGTFHNTTVPVSTTTPKPDSSSQKEENIIGNSTIEDCKKYGGFYRLESDGSFTVIYSGGTYDASWEYMYCANLDAWNPKVVQEDKIALFMTHEMQSAGYDCYIQIYPVITEGYTAYLDRGNENTSGYLTRLSDGSGIYGNTPYSFYAINKSGQETYYSNIQEFAINGMQVKVWNDYAPWSDITGPTADSFTVYLGGDKTVNSNIVGFKKGDNITISFVEGTSLTEYTTTADKKVFRMDRGSKIATKATTDGYLLCDLSPYENGTYVLIAQMGRYYYATYIRLGVDGMQSTIYSESNNVNPASTQAVGEETKNTLESSPMGASFRVTASSLILRAGPGTEYNRITSIPHNTVLYEADPSVSTYNWLYVEYQGQYGYVSKDYLA